MANLKQRECCFFIESFKQTRVDGERNNRCLLPVYSAELNSRDPYRNLTINIFIVNYYFQRLIR